ncbi:TM0106 family RecB-like putative nuclease [Nostoc sp. FACHB-888]|uniref:TM0106 family RecB-like putative nuclease n=1 Tax=Nostoc sp. FACHB-888 TaxID=2692842 RepID=UPI0016880C2C|nr:TM0106 family RecB-like putative nuclease [Nostoc sp. FACHB-888]MBD2247343.1 TM0106 family RecB-like putative nuclease [Nostoc sp. FACHB-888]
MSDTSVITSEIFVAYLQCPRKAFLLLFSEDKGKPHDYPLILEERRENNRTQYLEKLLQFHPEGREYDTKAFRKYEFLFDATLRSEQLEAYCAVLTKADTSSANRRISYQPTIVTGTYSITPEQKAELLFVGLVLGQIQQQVPVSGQIVGMDGKAHRVQLESGYKSIKASLKTLENWYNNPSSEPPALILNKHCTSCQFQQICREQAEKENNLSLLDRMTPKAIQQYNKRGIFTVHQLSYLFRPRRKRKKQKNPEPVKHSLELQALAIREQKIYIQELPELTRKPIELFLDIEGIPDQRVYYLMGLLVREGENYTQHSFWADVPKDEQTIWEQLLAKINEFPEAPIYHYGSYEPKAFHELAKRYSTDIEKVTKYLININSYIYGKIYFPIVSNSLKSIGAFIGFEWTESGASGLQTLVWRHQWEVEAENCLKETLIQYNIEDVFALERIVEVLEKIFFANNNFPTANVDEIKTESHLKWGKTNYQSNDFEIINKCAYFDYQRDKIYVRTNKRLKKVAKEKSTIVKKFNKIDKTIILPIQACPKCGHENVHRLNSPGKVVIDLKIIKNGIIKWVTHIKGNRFICPNCKTQYSTVNLKEVSKYGSDLIAWSMNQYITYRVGLNKVSDMLKENFNVMIPSNNIYRYKSVLAEKYKATLTEIMKSIIEGNLIHVDETDLSVKGFSSPYVWVFTNMDSVFYLFKPSRDASFLEELLKGFKGVLVSDFYSGYDALDCYQQKCLIHLIRDLNGDIFKEQFNNELKDIVVYFGRLLREIIATIDRYGLKKRNLDKHNKDVEKFYKEVIDKDYKTEIARAYQRRFLKNKEKLFTFLNHDEVPWNNNNAEHAIKPFARFRQDADGVLTENSINHYLVLLSVQQTCKYRGISFLQFLRSQETSIDKYSKFS